MSLTSLNHDLKFQPKLTHMAQNFKCHIFEMLIRYWAKILSQLIPMKFYEKTKAKN